jgi:hypothetical protein
MVDTKTSTKMTLFGITLPPELVFWFAAIMVIVTVCAIITRMPEALAKGITPNNIYIGFYLTARDAATFIPVVGLIIAITLHIRRNWMTIAAYFRQKTEEERQRIHAKGKAEGHAEGKAEGKAEGLQVAADWLRRRDEHAARGVPFDEPYPGADNDS